MKINSNRFINIAAIIFALGIIGASFYSSSDKSNDGAFNNALAARFEELSQNGNSTCSAVFKDSITEMPDTDHVKGSCCAPMSMHRYSEQIDE